MPRANAPPRAARRPAGALYVMSTSGATLVEDVAKERGSAPQWFQLYMQPDREATGALLDRCVKAGFKALVLTVDQRCRAGARARRGRPSSRRRVSAAST